MLKVDLNCDMGEGFPNDSSIMSYISSANIACGYHAGDSNSMRQTVELAIGNGVAIGAHPSYPDRKNFGRTDILHSVIKPGDLLDMIIEQIVALENICEEFGYRLHHVKPHGALYNRAAWDEELSVIICEAICQSGLSLILYGLSGSKMKTIAGNYQIKFANEVFADRTYRDDGSLSPRNEPNSMVGNPEEAAEQAYCAVKKSQILSVSGKKIQVIADTICIHGDTNHANDYAVCIHQHLKNNGIAISTI
ncbi:MAG TPA: 5-oxoprolinase subunit PxpA [Puia sp.]|nr:5-oxoprolinase subunit PxpA [Puia sp.]